MRSNLDERERALLVPTRLARGKTARSVAPHLVLAIGRDDDSPLVLADEARLGRALEATAREVAGTRAREDGGVARIDAPHASALPLAPRWLESALPGATSALVCVPSRDTLLFAVDADDDVVRRLADRAERAYHAARAPVSPAIYEARADGTLTPFRATGALANATALGHALLTMSEYEAQRAELDATTSADVSIAECQLVFRRDDDRPTTVATWGEQVTTLLPIVDVVVVAGGEPNAGGWRFAIAWDHLEGSAAASCWRRDESLVPARVRTVAWPDASTLRALYAARDALLATTASPPPEPG